MKPVARRLRTVVLVFLFVGLSVPIGVWMAHRSAEVPSIGWSPLYSSRVENALAPQKPTEVAAAIPLVTVSGCTLPTLSNCPQLTASGSTCVSTCSPSNCKTCANISTCCVTCNGGFLCSGTAPTCSSTCCCSTTSSTCVTCGKTCAGDTCQFTCGLQTLGGPTCTTTCKNCPSSGTTCSGTTCSTPTCTATCKTCLGTPTCSGTTCASTCSGDTCSWPTCANATCALTCKTCSGPTCSAATCAATCSGSTCSAPTCAGTTCSLTCQTCLGPTCSGTTCAAATCSGTTCTTPTCAKATCAVTCVLTCAASTGPNDFGNASSTYPIQLKDDGARHAVAAGPYLGARATGEADGLPATAPADNDGVWFTSSLVPGQTASLIVEASAAGYLDAWIDFRQSPLGWSAADSQILASRHVDAGLNVLFVRVPSAAVASGTWSRFRLSSAGGLRPTGAALDGEVEDYPVVICSQLLASIWTDKFAYRVGDAETIGFFLSETSDVTLVRHAADGSSTVLASMRMAAGPHDYVGPALSPVVAQLPAGTQWIELQAIGATSGCATTVATPFTVMP